MDYVSEFIVSWILLGLLERIIVSWFLFGLFGFFLRLTNKSMWCSTWYFWGLAFATHFMFGYASLVYGIGNFLNRKNVVRF